MQQLGVRLLVWVIDIIVNISLLAAFQAFSLGWNYAWSIVVFNAILILLIYAIDYVIVKWRMLSAEIRIGERIVEGNVHED